jgi:hypothetical protein
MAQVDSENSTSMPVDQARRRVLTIAAGGAIAAAIPAAALAAPPPAVDPIYAAINAHRRAYCAMQAVFTEHRRAHDLADAMVGSCEIEVSSMVEPGKTVLASYWGDVERAIPSEQYPDLYRHYCDVLEERRAAREAIIEPLTGDEDEATGEVAGPEFAALRRFAETTPTTLAGLLAMVIYAGEINDRDADAFDKSFPIFANMATAARALVGGQS